MLMCLKGGENLFVVEAAGGEAVFIVIDPLSLHLIDILTEFDIADVMEPDGIAFLDGLCQCLVYPAKGVRAMAHFP
jgi:hypothetical protein